MVGDVLLEKIGKTYHAAYVLAVDTDLVVVEGKREIRRPTSLLVWECNYKRCQCGTRTIPISEPDIRGILRTV